MFKYNKIIKKWFADSSKFFYNFFISYLYYSRIIVEILKETAFFRVSVKDSRDSLTISRSRKGRGEPGILFMKNITLHIQRSCWPFQVSAERTVIALYSENSKHDAAEPVVRANKSTRSWRK